MIGFVACVGATFKGDFLVQFAKAPLGASRIPALQAPRHRRDGIFDCLEPPHGSSRRISAPAQVSSSPWWSSWPRPSCRASSRPPGARTAAPRQAHSSPLLLGPCCCLGGAPQTPVEAASLARRQRPFSPRSPRHDGPAAPPPQVHPEGHRRDHREDDGGHGPRLHLQREGGAGQRPRCGAPPRCPRVPPARTALQPPLPFSRPALRARPAPCLSGASPLRLQMMGLLVFVLTATIF